MELKLSLQDVSALLFELSDIQLTRDKEQITVSELRLAIKALSYLIVQPNAVSSAGDLLEALDIDDDDGRDLLFGLVNRLSSIFATSPYAHISLNTATMLDDPWINCP